MTAEFSIVITTLDSEAKANDVARSVVEQGLAACAQIAPIRSVYRWEGKTEQAHEWRLDLKTRTADYAALEAAIRAIHPYDTPEILRVDIAEGYGPYMAWMRSG